MSKLRKILFSAAVAIGLVAAPLMPATVFAQNPAQQIQQGVTSVGGTQTGTQDLSDKIKTVVNTLLFILGAIAVVMIVIGGIRYTTSNGDASAIKGAKDTILYAVIGLVVAILAYAIVNFVISAFANGNGG